MPGLLNPFLTSAVLRTFSNLPTVASGNLAFTLPTGSAGQLMVAHIGFRGSAAFAMPAGWSQIAQVTTADTTTGGEVSGLVAWKVRGAGEPDPTFTRTGGGRANGAVMCYGVTGGSYTFNTSSTFAQGSASTTLSTTALTVSAVNSLVVVMGVMAVFDTTPSTSFAAAGLSAAAPTGTLVALSENVRSDRWGDLYFNAWPTVPVCAVHGWDLAGVPAGSTGAFSATSTGSSHGLMVAAEFRRTA